MGTVPPAVEALIADKRLVAHLSTSVNDRPHSAPLWYRYADGMIEIATTGQKLANIKQNPKVSLSIQSATDGIPDWMVTIRGLATVIEDDEASTAGKNRIHDIYDTPGDVYPENVLVQIDIGSVCYQTY